MNVVDSSGWLEYFADGANAAFFAAVIIDIEQLIVPVISIYEVFKRVLQQRNQADALQAVALMVQGRVVDLNQSIAIQAAFVSADLKLPMADSIILATARLHGAILWTQDAHFKDLADVRYIEKP